MSYLILIHLIPIFNVILLVLFHDYKITYQVINCVHIRAYVRIFIQTSLREVRYHFRERIVEFQIHVMNLKLRTVNYEGC